MRVIAIACQQRFRAMQRDNQILTVAQMRCAEQALIDAGDTVSSLMEIAGRGAADLVWRTAAHRPITVLCGPGNNGGDGYVIARELHRCGAEVRVIAPLEPATDAAKAARASCNAQIVDDATGGVLVDCLFGSGLTRALSSEHLALLQRLAAHHRIRIAVDMPSGIDSDSGAPLNCGLPDYALTIALGAWKFAHALIPAMTMMGELRLVPIGVEPVTGAAQWLTKPRLPAPDRNGHKYMRGLVLVVAGEMPGACVLACQAALRGGAGAVRLAARDMPPGIAPDVVHRPELAAALDDARTGSVLIGPGLGRGEWAVHDLETTLAANLPTVIDADALMLLTPAMLAERKASLILTPHGGELAKLLECFNISVEGKVVQARLLAQATGAVVVAKGPDTMIAAPDGRLTLAPARDGWLSVAGSGDVLAGIIASRLAVDGDAFAAAGEAVWLHGEAAHLSSAPFTASDLAHAVTHAYAACL